jgi:hypothetical protein
MKLSDKIREDLLNLKLSDLSVFPTTFTSFAKSLDLMFAHYQSAANLVLSEHQIRDVLFFYHLMGLLEESPQERCEVLYRTSIQSIIEEYMVNKRIPVTYEQSAIDALRLNGGIEFSLGAVNEVGFYIDSRQV